MMEEGGGRMMDGEEEGTQQRMEVTDRMVIACK